MNTHGLTWNAIALMGCLMFGGATARTDVPIELVGQLGGYTNAVAATNDLVYLGAEKDGGFG